MGRQVALCLNSINQKTYKRECETMAKKKKAGWKSVRDQKDVLGSEKGGDDGHKVVEKFGNKGVKK